MDELQNASYPDRKTLRISPNNLEATYDTHNEHEIYSESAMTTYSGNRELRKSKWIKTEDKEEII